MKNKIYVIGHKNPDTDSVCSALAYARYKEMTDGQNGEYIAMRAGELNPETEYVLNYFGLEAPALAEDVRPQLKDTAFGKGLSISEDISLKKAWDMLNKSASNTLTMTDGEGNVKGIISVGDIARSFMASSDSGVLSAASTPVKNVVETIGAQLVCGNPDAVINSGRVMIASTEADLDRCSVSGGDTVLLVDDEKAQKKAVINGAACIIVCLGADPATKIIKLAEDNGCALLKSPMDTLTTARMLNQSVPVSHFMKKEGILMFNEEDITEDVKDAAADTRHREFPVLDKEGKFVGVVTREDLIKTGKKKLILVDHNEKTQAVGGMTQADVLEVIDHHKIGRIAVGHSYGFHAHAVQFPMRVGFCRDVFQLQKLFRIFAELSGRIGYLACLHLYLYFGLGQHVCHPVVFAFHHAAHHFRLRVGGSCYQQSCCNG